MSMMQRLEERRDELTAELAAIESKAVGFNRGFSSGEMSRREELGANLKAISKKIKEARAADDLSERIALATPAGMFDF